MTDHELTTLGERLYTAINAVRLPGPAILDLTAALRARRPWAALSSRTKVSALVIAAKLHELAEPGEPGAGFGEAVDDDPAAEDAAPGAGDECPDHLPEHGDDDGERCAEIAEAADEMATSEAEAPTPATADADGAEGDSSPDDGDADAELDASTGPADRAPPAPEGAQIDGEASPTREQRRPLELQPSDSEQKTNEVTGA